ncbi:ribose-5-phosphate isomerase [Dermabacteraceae bacterium P13101]|nr:ribose-5-phosphate isomerase [Dermabacteraceae bacterium TAE3-ERU5]
MRVHIGTDHAGFELKNRLVKALGENGHDVVDHGAHSYEPLDDYPPFCTAVGEAVVAERAAGQDSLGVVIGGSGNGEQIAANKVLGVRAALVWNRATAELARQHNDANVISVGARQHSEEELLELIELFLATDFSHEERHQRRIDLVGHYEKDGTYPQEKHA